MARIAFALDPAIEDRLLADVVEHGHEVVDRAAGWRELVARIEESAPDVLVVGAGRSTFSAELLGAADLRGIRVIALAHDDRDRAHANGIGLHEVLGSDAGWREIEGFVSGGIAVPTGAGPTAGSETRGTGATIAVWGPAGAPGRTTFAITLAAELAAAGRRVALVDADPYGGSVAPALGLLDEAPGFASACRLAGADALDRSELERLAQRCSSARASFDVFTGLVGPSRWPELSHERVQAALAAIRTNVEFVVVDTGFSLEVDEELTSDQFAPRRNAATFAALESADRVVAIGLADPVGLSRLLRGHAELVERVDPARIDVVVNRVRASALGIDAFAQVRQTLQRFAGIRSAVLLPHDARGTDAAILRARTLRDAAPRSPLATAIREYAQQRLLPGPAPERRRRRRAPALAPVRRTAPADSPARWGGAAPEHYA